MHQPCPRSKHPEHGLFFTLNSIPDALTLQFTDEKKIPKKKETPKEVSEATRGFVERSEMPRSGKPIEKIPH